LEAVFFKDFIQALNMILWSSIETNRCKWSGMITYAPTDAPYSGPLPAKSRKAS
jgi:hypothetical protein